MRNARQKKTAWATGSILSVLVLAGTTSAQSASSNGDSARPSIQPVPFFSHGGRAALPGRVEPLGKSMTKGVTVLEPPKVQTFGPAVDWSHMRIDRFEQNRSGGSRADRSAPVFEPMTPSGNSVVAPTGSASLDGSGFSARGHLGGDRFHADLSLNSGWRFNPNPRVVYTSFPWWWNGSGWGSGWGGWTLPYSYNAYVPTYPVNAGVASFADPALSGYTMPQAPSASNGTAAAPMPENLSTTERAVLALGAGDYGASIKLLREQLRSSPNDAEAIRLMGFAKLLNRQTREGAEDLGRAYLAQPTLAAVAFDGDSIGIDERGMRDLTDAVVSLPKRIKSPAACVAAAALLHARDNRPAALRMLKDAEKAGADPEVTGMLVKAMKSE